jgi:hypothetical protein
MLDRDLANLKRRREGPSRWVKFVMHSCMHGADREGPSIGHLGPAYVRGTVLNMDTYPDYHNRIACIAKFRPLTPQKVLIRSYVV